MKEYNIQVEHTVDLGNNEYIQKAKDEDGNYSLMYRQGGRYAQPVEIASGIKNQRDADQLMITAAEDGISQLLEPSNEALE